MDYLKQLIVYLQQYPQLVAVICGVLANIGLVASLETVIPPHLASWAQKLITFVTGFVVAVGVSLLVWRGLDPKDATTLQWGVSIMAALIAPLLYIWVSRALAHFFPWITAWTTPGGSK